MMEEYFKADIPDDLHMADADGAPGFVRGLLFDDDNSLQGQALFQKIDLGDETDEGGSTAGIALLIGAAAVAVWEFGKWGIKKIKEARHRDAEEDEAKSETCIDAVDETVYTDECPVAIEVSEETLPSVDCSQDNEQRRTISSEEAKQEVLEIMALASMLKERLDRLANSEIDNSGDDEALQLESNLTDGTAILEGVNRILSGEVQLFTEAQIGVFEDMLGRNLYRDDCYVPVSMDEYRSKLLPTMDEVRRNDNEDGTSMTSA